MTNFATEHRFRVQEFGEHNADAIERGQIEVCRDRAERLRAEARALDLKATRIELGRRNLQTERTPAR